MKIKVYGTPNKYAKVRVLNPVTHNKVLKTVFRFDENGVAEVETEKLRPRLVKAVMQRYKYEEVSPALIKEKTAVTDEQIVERDETAKVYKCKQCELEFDAPFKLAQHVRKEHPKGGK